LLAPGYVERVLADAGDSQGDASSLVLKSTARAHAAQIGRASGFVSAGFPGSGVETAGAAVTFSYVASPTVYD
jgi:hypothetical protein